MTETPPETQMLEPSSSPLPAASAPMRWPIFTTIIVAAAVAVMIALGVWQLQRGTEKAALRQTYAHNLTLPAMAYPAMDSTDAEVMFRTVSANCLRVVGWTTTGGTTAADVSGWRHIATCATGAEGPGFLADLGVGQDPATPAVWRGGPVRGIAVNEPQTYGLITKLFGNPPKPRLMIIAETPAPGLVASRRPDPANISDDHLSYAIQWFIFAAAAAIIYVLALRRRARGSA